MLCMLLGCYPVIVGYPFDRASHSGDSVCMLLAGCDLVWQNLLIVVAPKLGLQNKSHGV